jgi:AcrR family transcriptional regulator
LQVTKPTLYYYIQNKEEILFECHRVGVELLREAVAGVSVGQASAAQRLRATMLAYASVVMDDFCRCLIRVGEEPLPLANRQELGQLKLALDREFRSIVQSGLDDASFEPCDPKIAAFTLAGALNWMGRWFDASGPLSKEEVALRTTDVLLNGLLRRTKQPQEIPLPRRRKVGKSKPVGG